MWHDVYLIVEKYGLNTKYVLNAAETGSADYLQLPMSVHRILWLAGTRTEVKYEVLNQAGYGRYSSCWRSFRYKRPIYVLGCDNLRRSD